MNTSAIGSSDLLSYYNDIYANNSKSSASKLQDNLEKKDYAQADEDELLEVCKDFEAYFVEQVLKEMKNMIPKNEDSSGADKYLDYFGDNYIQQLAETVTESNNGKGLGLAQSLYEQMKRNYGIES